MTKNLAFPQNITIISNLNKKMLFIWQNICSDCILILKLQFVILQKVISDSQISSNVNCARLLNFNSTKWEIVCNIIFVM